MKHPGAQQHVPDTSDLADLARAAAACQGCDLWSEATQTVFGIGAVGAPVMLVGEQPGDTEDVRGEPFVGPAGQLLDRALRDAGLDRSTGYVSNAVKHFRFRQLRGSTRRIHEKPTAAQSTACRPWLAAEIAAVSPTALVALGATAAASLFGPAFRVTEQRGRQLSWPPPAGPFVADVTDIGAAFATIHPSAVLRADPPERGPMYAALVADLQVVARYLTA